ncbi:MAG: esterase-like activity of phytase family protein, partial [Propionibacteriaceae bacterium]|nr:esterase-like activity of phytase family protein [Propionibacteriaceae bacterium]
GRYDVATGTFHWYGYRLEATTAAGDWMGLSEITAIDDHTFAVIERDKLNGPAARVKRVYTVSVPTDDGLVTDPGGQLPVLDKSLALDVLPALRATRGWTQEKLEGFAIAGGRVYAVTDNDGLKDATGETVFLRLGKAGRALR